jgi:hypothetical protein
LKIVDFHNHFIGPDWPLTTTSGLSGAARQRWERINVGLQSEDALLGSIESAGIAARVVNSPTAFIQDADGNVPLGADRRLNDRMAELVARHPGRLYGLATVDAFSGDAAARELTRAVSDEIPNLRVLVSFTGTLRVVHAVARLRRRETAGADVDLDRGQSEQAFAHAPRAWRRAAPPSRIATNSSSLTPSTHVASRRCSPRSSPPRPWSPRHNRRGPAPCNRGT